MHMLEQHMGQDHVSAQDQADENMAQFGSGTYLTKYKDAYPTVEMTSANQLTIGTGSLLVNGRHCIIDTPEVLTVDNGSSGMTERDLVCVHWKEVEAEVQAASGNDTQTITKEEVDLVIVKGTPASSGATDPEISQDTIRSGVGEAWVPFARITKDGLTPSVAFTVDKMAPESEFRDSISRTPLIKSFVSMSKTIAAGSTASVEIAIEVPEGYVYAGVASFITSEWHIAPSKITRLSNGNIAANLVNAGNSTYSAKLTVEVLFLPDL